MVARGVSPETRIFSSADIMINLVVGDVKDAIEDG